jgi:hypothetical protein
MNNEALNNDLNNQLINDQSLTDNQLTNENKPRFIPASITPEQTPKKKRTKKPSYFSNLPVVSLTDLFEQQKANILTIYAINYYTSRDAFNHITAVIDANLNGEKEPAFRIRTTAQMIVDAVRHFIDSYNNEPISFKVAKRKSKSKNTFYFKILPNEEQ